MTHGTCPRRDGTGLVPGRDDEDGPVGDDACPCRGGTGTVETAARLAWLDDVGAWLVPYRPDAA